MNCPRLVRLAMVALIPATISLGMASVQAQYKAIHQSTDPQINEARQKGREQIRAILAPEQKPKFEEFLKRLDEDRKRNAQQ